MAPGYANELGAKRALSKRDPGRGDLLHAAPVPPRGTWSGRVDADGRTNFNRLLFRRQQPWFYAFDLLALNGWEWEQRWVFAVRLTAGLRRA